MIATDNAENQMISAGGVNYLCDGDGKRVTKAPSSTPTQPNYIYWYGATSSPVIETNGAGAFQYRYISFNGMRVSREEANNWVDHYGLDALGNARFVFASNGGSGGWDVSDFYPFGGERVVQSNSNNHYKFTGKERDSESGLDNFGARFDSSTLGRFISPDSGVDQHPEAPQSWNLYDYALNNPLNLVDPTGEYVCGSGVTETMCDNFQKSLDVAQAAANKLKESYGANSTEYNDAQRAIDVYGKENIDNGVTLTLGGQPAGASGQVDPSVGSVAPTTDNPLGQKITIHFDKSAFTGSGDNALEISHEGSHAADASDWVKSGFSAAMNPNNYNSEFKAFRVTQGIAEMSGWPYLGFVENGKDFFLWKEEWMSHPGWGKRVDSAIDSMLRSKSGIYQANPNAKIGAFKHNTKGNQ